MTIAFPRSLALEIELMTTSQSYKLDQPLAHRPINQEVNISVHEKSIREIAKK
ncbi:MAG: hypothetical protein KKE11_02530 [Gammaproteobacteria bacterium]|nr:hypothetical protein [Gammaproteobacteria bacterium]